MDLTLLQPPMLTHSGVEIARYKNPYWIHEYKYIVS